VDFRGFERGDHDVFGLNCRSAKKTSERPDGANPALIR